MPRVVFITASTSGHTSYVVDVLQKQLSSADNISIASKRAEEAVTNDLLSGDVLVLGSGTWNTGGREGQLNMHMHALLMERAQQVDLQQNPITFISLGDDRYYFTTRCTEHFLRFQREHNGKLLLQPLILVNEPYGQEEKIRMWGTKLLGKITNNLGGEGNRAGT